MESEYVRKSVSVNTVFLLISELQSQKDNFLPLNKGASEYPDLYPCEQPLPIRASVMGERHITTSSSVESLWPRMFSKCYPIKANESGDLCSFP